MTPAERERRTASLIAARIKRGQAPTIQSPVVYALLAAALAKQRTRPSATD